MEQAEVVQGRGAARAEFARLAARALALALCAGAAGCLPFAGRGLWPEGARSGSGVPATSTPPGASPMQPDGPPVPWRTIGTSLGGQPIEAASLGSGARRVLFIGGMHGNEFGPDIIEAFAARLVEQPGLVPAGAQIHLIRRLNPDGRSRGGRGNDNGVDLNRNLPSMNWKAGPVIGLKGPTGLTAGRDPASEPETQVLVKYLRNRFVRVISIHSKGHVIDYSGPGAKALAIRLGAVAGYEVDHMTYASSITGSLGSYFPERYRGGVLTIEVPDRMLTPRLLSALVAAAR